jgi:alpha-L-rhamnosidase
MDPTQGKHHIRVRSGIGVIKLTHLPRQLGLIRRFVSRRQLVAVLCVGFILLACASQAAALQVSTAVASGTGAHIRPAALKTENVTELLGIETSHPRFRWLLDSDARGGLQTGYQVLVATSLEKLQADRGDKWDSGKVSSDNSIEVPYAGSELASGERCYWKVRVWDKDGRTSAYSAPSFFEMGLRKQTDWQGKWIAAKKGVSSPIFRRDISIDRPFRRARVYISGLGYYELFINGKKVGDRALDPASTYYNNDQPFKLNTRVLYATYDATPYLQSGPNAIGVMLGNGWYSAEPDVPPSPGGRAPYGDRPRLILQMNVELADGRRLSAVSDSTWKTSRGPIVYNDLFNGETYDARLEHPG